MKPKDVLALEAHLGEAVEQMNGRIWLDSVERTGTTFYFTVPDPPSAEA